MRGVRRSRAPGRVGHRYHPYDTPIVGRDAVVASWLGEERALRVTPAPATRRAPTRRSTLRSRWTGTPWWATGTSWYRELPDGPVVRAYDNCFVMRFDGEGRCCEFTEYHLRRP